MEDEARGAPDRVPVRGVGPSSPNAYLRTWQLHRFLDAGEPPIYFGFGSVRAPEGIARRMIAAARALGRRAILARAPPEVKAVLAPIATASPWRGRL